LQDGHLFCADEPDGRGFIIVGERDEFHGGLGKPKCHAGANAERTMVVDVEFHGVSFVGSLCEKK